MMFSINKQSIKYVPMPNGVAFSADLYENETHIGTIHNNGNGGDTFLNLKNGWNSPEYQRLKAECDNNQYTAMEWYLEWLMDVAEKVVRLPLGKKVANR